MERDDTQQPLLEDTDAIGNCSNSTSPSKERRSNNKRAFFLFPQQEEPTKNLDATMDSDTTNTVTRPSDFYARTTPLSEAAAARAASPATASGESGTKPRIWVSAHDDNDQSSYGQLTAAEPSTNSVSSIVNAKRRGSSTSSNLSGSGNGPGGSGMFGRRKRGTALGNIKMQRSSSDVGPTVQHLQEERQMMQDEEERLSELVDFQDVHVDPAPFQVSQRTSLHKIHSLFVLLRLNQAYVTHQGRLVGIVTIKEVQQQLSHPLVHKMPYRKLGKQRKTASATIGGGDKGMAIIMPEES